MTTGTITGTVTVPVTIGTAQYAGDSGLHIVSGGAIAPSAYGAAAVTAPSALPSAHLYNDGLVAGATAANVTTGYGGSGGDGILFETAGRIVNRSNIEAGGGGRSARGFGGNGGVGVALMQGGTLINAGFVGGGGGAPEWIYAHGRQSGNGGAAVLLGGAGAVYNSVHGMIYGGSGAQDGQYLGYSTASAAVDFEQGGFLDNAGAIRGGMYSQAAVLFSGVGTLHNSGHIYTGTGGIGVQLLDGGSVFNAGTITGGVGHTSYYNPAIPSGAGLVADGAANLRNTGTITGGHGYDARAYKLSTAGAAGVLLNGSTVVLTNTGTIEGGRGGIGYEIESGGMGGTGAEIYGATLTNMGMLGGGNGGLGGRFGGYAGAGGLGVLLDTGKLVNDGTIFGGMPGGSPVYSFSDGGAGVIVQDALLDNVGTIIGGSTPVSFESQILNGSGVILQGGTVVNTGTITGGSTTIGEAMDGTGGSGVSLQAGTLDARGGMIAAGTYVGKLGDAVQFGTVVAATLIVHAGASFSGAIAGYAAVNDEVQLAAGGQGTLSGFGAAGGITNITSIVEDQGAHWTLSGTLTPVSSLLLDEKSVLTLNGSDSGTLYFGNGGHERLFVAADAGFQEEMHGFGAGDQIIVDGVQASSFSFNGDILSLLDSAGGTLASLDFATNGTAANFGMKNLASGTEVFWKTSSASWADPVWHAPMAPVL